MLAHFQEALVALATDPTRRERFHARGGGAFEDLSLDAAELRALASIPPPAWDRYARSLVAKRWEEVAGTVVLTRRIVPDLAGIYRAWAVAHPMTAADGVLTPGAAEARRALHALREALSSPRYAEYAKDLLAFEVLAACSREDGARRTLSSRWHVGEIAADLEMGLMPIDPVERTTVFRFEGASVRWRHA
jgi:hypothetical protein